MITFIDESGSFAEAARRGAWNVVAAYVIPERSQTAAKSVLATLKNSVGYSKTKEIKLNDLTELQYQAFLRELQKLPGCMFGAATDAGLNQAALVIEHRDNQAVNIRNNVPRMLYESGKRSVEQLASDLASLSPQLYVQLQCQVRLVDDVLRRGMLYFVQRDPVTLGRFKWRIDQKTSPKATFEKTFRSITPGFLQSMSAREPAISLEEEDYSYFAPYMYGPSEIPEFYSEHYGKPKGDVINIGKIMRENLEFPDSQDNAGVQIADLLASGLRRCLRNEFNNSEAVMADLAQLMIDNIRGKYPIQLLGFDPQEQPVERHVATCMRLMDKFSRHLLTEQP